MVAHVVAIGELAAWEPVGEGQRALREALLRDAEARVQKITLAADGSPAGTTPLDPG